MERARKFALDAHGDQKYGEHPYSVHLGHVAEIAIQFEAPLPVRKAAWLHDVLEDTAVTYGELEAVFGLEITELVHAVTNMPGNSRAESHALTYPALRSAGTWAVLLKLCDRLANARMSAASSPNKLLMYRAEFHSFHTTLYRPNEHEPIWAELELLLR